MSAQHVFEGKIALVTGSGRGIGKAIAKHLAQLGADIIVNFFRNRAPAQSTLEEIQKMGRRAWLVKADIGAERGLAYLFDTIGSEIGGLDFLIMSAASGYNRPVMQQRVKGWDWTLNINARAALFAAQKAAPLMQARGGGAIVNISSPGSSRVLPEYVVVGASKAALEAISRYLAVELSAMNIVVNAVSPGLVWTDALQHFSVIRKDENLIEKALQLTPAGRLVTPDDVAHVVPFLCSPAASMIRGQTILVDGGYSLPIQGVSFNQPE
jgi:enoyl-[acyl-carrier protein] reductase III